MAFSAEWRRKKYDDEHYDRLSGTDQRHGHRGRMGLAAGAGKGQTAYRLPAELPPLYPEMTVREYLTFAAKLKKVPGLEQLQQVVQAMNKTGLIEEQDHLIAHCPRAIGSV